MSSVDKRHEELERQRAQIQAKMDALKNLKSSPAGVKQKSEIVIKSEPGSSASSNVCKKAKPCKRRFQSMLSQFQSSKPAQVKLENKPQVFNESSSDDDGEYLVEKKAAVKTNVSKSIMATGKVMVKAELKQQQHAAATPVAKRKKSRWGEKIDLSDIAPPGFAQIPGMQTPQMPPVVQPQLNMPQGYRPAGLVGVSELSDAQKKQLEEQREMQVMYNMIMASRNQQMQQQQQQQQPETSKKNKYAYDSDEEIDEKGGTWEHKQRRMEMEKTQALAEKLTSSGHGKHFIGDFLPPAQLEKFMETFKALKEGRTPDYSDYKEFKIQCDNIGFKMLEKMGWKEGEGLGNDGQGITAPVNKGKRSLDGAGVGVESGDVLNKNDDDFSAFRKRMMLAYRFRPNPLNNPRRPYY